MIMASNVFNALAEAIISALTRFITVYSGLLQIAVYLAIGTIFSYALLKAWQTFRALGSFDFAALGDGVLPFLERTDRGGSAPLAVVTASFFHRAKGHYAATEGGGSASYRATPPDAYLRDAASQYSYRYFEEKHLEPIALMANLMPPLGFIGTIIGMVVHFLANNASLNSNLSVAGIATALYTTFVGLVCYTVLELLLKIFSGMARRRIDDGLVAVPAGMAAVPERKAAWE
jgi:biopolymer transport protein ExbB